ncbi:hypothetical protein DNTS_007694 [Danionella cerebrum]|uniref:Uncharacterized protein n=1 Tax=Danionella cerebrum TaxID=2873325 RepID=A0A553QSA2_9TELE|nr:hypothetical protein DNTS_007694 [Danionella translucida]
MLSCRGTKNQVMELPCLPCEGSAACLFLPQRAHSKVCTWPDALGTIGQTSSRCSSLSFVDGFAVAAPPDKTVLRARIETILRESFISAKVKAFEGQVFEAWREDLVHPSEPAENLHGALWLCDSVE